MIDHFLIPRKDFFRIKLSFQSKHTFFHRIDVDLHCVSLDSVTLYSLTIESFSKYGFVSNV
jgi:hypothetical protein